MAFSDWLGGISDTLFGASPYVPTQRAPNIRPDPPGGIGGGAYGGGLLDPRGIREQALWQGLGALSSGLIASGQRRPAMQPSLLPQALGAFQPAYNAGIQSGAQYAALEQQARDQQRMEELRASDPRYRNLPSQAIVALASRPLGRPLTAAEITARGLTPGLPWEITEHGNVTVPSHDPRVLEAGAGATARGDVAVRGVDLGFTGQRGYPNVPAPSYGPQAVPPAVAPPAAGGAPRQAPPGTPGGTRPVTPPSPAQSTALTAIGSDPLAYPGGPHDPYRGWEPGQPDLPITAPPPPTRAAPPPQTAPAAPAPAPPAAPAVRSTDPQMRNAPGYGRVFGTDPAALRRAQGTAETQDAYTRTTIIPQINNGVQTIEVVRRMREQAADPAMQFGPGAGAANTVAQFLRSWGGEAGRALADRVQSEGFSVLEGLSTQQLLASLGGSLGPGISNADVAIISRTVPNPFQSRETFTRFIDLVESRALNNVQTAHNAYRRTVPDWSADRDPVSAHMIERLEAQGIDTAPLLAQRQRQGGGAPPARPAAPAAPPPPAPPPPPRPRAAVSPPMVNGQIDIDALTRAGAGARYRLADGKTYEFVPADIQARTPARFREVPPE